MDPTILIAVAELLGDEEFQTAIGTIVGGVSLLIASSTRFGGERFKIAKRVFRALKGEKQ